jgi:hypothetical protein
MVCRWAWGPRIRGGRELLFLELLLERIKGPIEHLDDIAGGDPVAQELLDATELLIHILPDGELQYEAFRRKRRQLRYSRSYLDAAGLDVSGRRHWPRG